MLATIPITKTTASRLTPELRDNAAFGAVFSDHMLVADFVSGKWGEPRIIPYGAQPLAAAPARARITARASSKASRRFRAPTAARWCSVPTPITRAWRRPASAWRCRKCRRRSSSTARSRSSQLDRNWIPEKDNSALYVRPVLFATGETLGVKPSETFRFIIETCPSAPYFSGSVDLIAEDTYVRAFPGGTGAAKCGGNYAGSMLAVDRSAEEGLPQRAVARRHRAQVRRRGRPDERRVRDRRHRGHAAARRHDPAGHHARQRADAAARSASCRSKSAASRIDEVFDAHAKGTLQGAAGIGTAAVIAPLGRLRHKDREITLPAMGADSPLMRGRRRARRHPLGQDRRSPQLVGDDLTGQSG